MKNNLKNLLCLVLALCMALSLAACGGKGNEEKQPGKPGNEDAAAHPDYVYTAKFLPISKDENNYIRFLNVTDDGIYCTTDRKVGTEVPEGAKVEYEGQYDVYKTFLCLMSSDGKLTDLAGYEPLLPEDAGDRKNFNSNSSIMALIPRADGTLMSLENSYSSWFEGPDDITPDNDSYWDYYKYEENYFIRVLDKEGNEQSSTKIEVDENTYINAQAVGIDKDGNSVFSADTKIVAVAPDGSTVYTIEVENYIDRLLDLGDGKIYVSYWGEEGPALSELDTVNKKLGEPIALPNGAYDLYPGGEYDICYTNGLYLYGLNLGEEPVKLLNWLDADVNSNDVRYFSIRPDGSVIGLCSTWDRENEQNSYELLTMTKQPYDAVPHKEELTLSVLYLDQQVKEQIIKYNRSSDKYRVVVKDYSEYNTEDDWSAGQTKLITEIMSGELPDILSVSGLPYNQLAAKGLIEDIYPFIDADSELKREDFHQNLLKAFEVDGKLCQVVPSFNIVTAVGADSVVGEYDKWTYNEFKDALSKMPEGCMPFGPYMNRASVLQITLAMDINLYADWTTGKCSFDSPEFTELLNFAKSFPETVDFENGPTESESELIKSGMIMLKPTVVGDFESIQYDSFYFGGNAKYIGIPSAGGGGSAFSADSGYAITKNCSNKEAAWDFLRTILTEKYQNNLWWGLPTNVHAFDAKLKKAMTPEYEKDADGNYVLDEEGNKIEVSYGSMIDEAGNEYKIHAITEEQAANIRSLMDNTTKLMDESSKLSEIVVENAEAFFSGQKSAEEVAKLIQSKANIYINEQR